MTATSDDEAIRLTVPAEPDFVHVVRVAVRVVAGRAGCTDDARSRLQAAVGAAFFEVVDRAPDGDVRATLTTGDSRLTVAITADPPTAPLDPTSVAGLADGHELTDDGRSLVVWIAT